jgi:hypothetical protein
VESAGFQIGDAAPLLGGFEALRLICFVFRGILGRWKRSRAGRVVDLLGSAVGRDLLDQESGTFVQALRTGVDRGEVIESPRGAGAAVRLLAVAAPPSKPTIHMSQVDFIKR